MLNYRKAALFYLSFPNKGKNTFEGIITSWTPLPPFTKCQKFKG